MTIAARVPPPRLAVDEAWARPVRRRNLAGSAGRAASLALHAVVMAPAFLLVAPVLPPTEAPSMQAEVISAGDFEALRGIASAQPTAPAAEPVPPAPSPSTPPAAAAPAGAASPPSAPDMIHPTRMLSETALADPRSRSARRALLTLADEERIAQLCDLEAMEQIHAWRSSFQPDRLVDYALSDTRMDGNTLVAHGGAFRSGRQWYEVSFRCELDPAQRKITGFAFRVGEAIPREEWVSYNLPALH